MADKIQIMGREVKVPVPLLRDLRALIVEARKDVARQVNSALVLLYWRVGKRIYQDILKEKRAEYGEEILSTLSRKLVAEFGNGFSLPNLFLCASKSEEHIELLQLAKSGIRIAAYMTELPPRHLLRRKLHETMALAHARLEWKNQDMSAGD